MDEKKFLANFAKILGAESTFEELEQKRLKEERMLASLSKSLGAEEVLEELMRREEKIIEDTNALLDKFPIFESDEAIIEQKVQITEDAKQEEPEIPASLFVTPEVKKIAKGSPKTADEIAPSLRKELDYIKKSITDFHRFAQRHSQMGGGGEVNLRYLDDVNRSTIVDGRWLRYDGPTRKFVFDDINPYQVVYNTTEVTTSTYTVQAEDYYIGVNYAGPVQITLPTSTNSGRILVIKDEDGDAETNPITVLGTVDNDSGGFIIQINNGAIQLIYRNGWRII